MPFERPHYSTRLQASDLGGLIGATGHQILIVVGEQDGESAISVRGQVAHASALMKIPYADGAVCGTACKQLAIFRYLDPDDSVLVPWNVIVSAMSSLRHSDKVPPIPANVLTKVCDAIWYIHIKVLFLFPVASKCW